MIKVLSFQDLQKRIENNDRRSTSRPYLLLLQQKKEYVCHDEYHDSDTKTVYRFGDADSTSESWYDLVKDLFRGGYSKKEIEKGIEKFEMGHYWETENIFLTDDGYKEHMDLNSHNVHRGKGHRTYGIHAFRNPEIIRMFSAIETCAKMESLLSSCYHFINRLPPTMLGDRGIDQGADLLEDIKQFVVMK